MVNIYCVKWGTKYDRSFVEKLKTSIEKNLTIEYKFNCFTDKPEKDYDIPITHPELRGVWHKLALFQFTGENLFFDLDIKINDNIDFLAERFDKFTCVDSTPWKKHKIRSLAINNDTLINTSIMRWTDNKKIFDKFLKHRDLYLRLYQGIDRFIWNEEIKHSTFKGTAISSWQEGIENNTIVLYNGRYV